MAWRWWLHYKQYGELPIEMAVYMRKMQKKYNWLPQSVKINKAELEQLKQILIEQPNLFLDEIAIVFGIQNR